jgi:allophanate hydrolase subunit 2
MPPVLGSVVGNLGGNQVIGSIVSPGNAVVVFDHGREVYQTMGVQPSPSTDATVKASEVADIAFLAKAAQALWR